MSWTEFHPFVQEAIRTTVAVGLLVGLVLIARKPFAKRFGAKAAYMLWALPLVRFALPPLPSSWSLTGWLGLSAGPVESAPVAEIVIAAQPTSGFGPAIPTPPVVIDIAEPTLANPSALSQGLLEGVLAQAPLILTLVWITGTLLWLSRSFRQQDTFLQLISDDSEPVSEHVQREFEMAGHQVGLKRLPDIRASLLCSGPLVTGLWKPTVLLPIWFEEDYNAAERRDALVHELMHLKRRDLWSFQIARIVTATQWFNPLAHMALSAFRTDQEAACDADVLALGQVSPASYGRTLVKAARLACPSDRRIAAASLTLAHPIKERLIMMQHPKPSLRSRLTGTAFAGVLGAAGLFSTASCMSAQADNPDADIERTFVFRSGDNQEQQTILLSDPMNGLQGRLADLGAMTAKATSEIKIEFDFDEMDFDGLTEGLMELETLDSLAELESLSELAILDGLDALMEIETSDGANIFVLRPGEDMEAFEARIEEWAERFEERAERWEEDLDARAEQLERHAEIIALRVEKNAEAWAEAHEARAEALADAHEARAEAWAAQIESQFGEDFEESIEASADVIESLSEQCDDRDRDDLTPEIVSATNAETGETHKALCLNGGPDRLQEEGLEAWILGRTDLNQAEKDKFLASRDHTQSYHFEFHSHHHDGEEELEGGAD